MLSLILTTALMTQCQPAGCWRRGWFHRPAPVCWSAPPVPVYYPATADPDPLAVVPAVALVEETETADTIEEAAAELAAVVAADPYGFTAWLNATRAAHGLHAVAYSANLTAWAATNNAQQVIRGLGHWVMGPALWQDAGWGPGQTIFAAWMNHPPHRAALLAPGIRRIGIAGSGAYWTYNAE